MLGSTGSIGTNTLEVIAASQVGSRRSLCRLTRGSSSSVEQAQQHRPRWVIATDRSAAGI